MLMDIINRMKKYTIFVFTFIIILAVSSTVLAAIALDKDMVALDKIYIAALSVTNQNDKNMSKNAMKLLVPQWQSFNKKHLRDFSKDKAAKNDFAKIGRMIDDAARIVQLNEQMTDAHDSLEGVRSTLLNLRKRNSIDYYIDYLTKFHEPMENAVLMAKGKTPETLSSENISTIKNLLADCLRDWEAVKQAKFDGDLFNFPPEKDKKRQEYIEAETQALDKLRQVLEGENKEAIIKTTMAIKANFAQLFIMFGDFSLIK
jgi:hypothetical protein